MSRVRAFVTLLLAVEWKKLHGNSQYPVTQHSCLPPPAGSYIAPDASNSNITDPVHSQEWTGFLCLAVVTKPAN